MPLYTPVFHAHRLSSRTKPLSRLASSASRRDDIVFIFTLQIYLPFLLALYYGHFFVPPIMPSRRFENDFISAIFISLLIYLFD